jgi:CubicO group peptidase (beta-lactamase class C family)
LSPGTVFGYSGEGFEYVARFAERRTGALFETLARDMVLAPAGMTSTSYTFWPWFSGRVAVPTAADGAPLAPQFSRRWLASDLVYSTPSDYARFLIGVLRGDGVTPALAAERARIQVSQLAALCPTPDPVCPRAAGIGLAWEVYQFGDDTFLMHTGKDDGLFTFAYMNLTTRSATVIFTSSDQGGDMVLPILERIAADPAFVAFLRKLA